MRQATQDMWRFIERTMSPLSDQRKVTLIHLLEKVRGSELQHYTPEDEIRISGGYETSDPSRLIERLGKYASRSTPKAKRQPAAKPAIGGETPQLT